MVRDLLAETVLDVPVDAVVGDVQLAAEEPLRVGKLPLEQLVERFEPGDALAAFPLPEGLPAFVVDARLRVCLGGEFGGRWEPPLLEQERVDVL